MRLRGAGHAVGVSQPAVVAELGRRWLGGEPVASSGANRRPPQTMTMELIDKPVLVGAYPFLQPSPQHRDCHAADVHECGQQCARTAACRFGTFISAGPHRNECWLSASGMQPPVPCPMPCQSFVKRGP